VGENVRGILSWSDGLVLEEVYADLEAEGYEVETFVLPAVGINAPHRRDRVWIIAHANSDARRSESSEGGRTELKTDSDGESSIHLGSEPNGNEGNATDTTSIGLHRQEHEQELGIKRRNEFQFGKSENKGDASDTERLRLELGQDATDIHRLGSQTQGERNQSAINITPDDNVHSEQGGPSEIWDGFPIKSPLCSGDDGLPTELDGLALPKWRKESIMGYGNAIVPQIAHRIFATIDEIESQKS
jgi:DNA (cytosine-5)-methyltransferase 1